MEPSSDAGGCHLALARNPTKRNTIDRRHGLHNQLSHHVQFIVEYSGANEQASILQSRSQFGAYAYDEELRIMLNDWYHSSVYSLNTMIQHNSLGNGDASLINGKGESKLCSYNGSTNTITSIKSDGTTVSSTSFCKGNREVFKINRNKTYLVRVLNATNVAFIQPDDCCSQFLVLMETPIQSLLTRNGAVAV